MNRHQVTGTNRDGSAFGRANVRSDRVPHIVSQLYARGHFRVFVDGVAVPQLRRSPNPDCTDCRGVGRLAFDALAELHVIECFCVVSNREIA